MKDRSKRDDVFEEQLRQKKKTEVDKAADEPTCNEAKDAECTES